MTNPENEPLGVDLVHNNYMARQIRLSFNLSFFPRAKCRHDDPDIPLCVFSRSIYRRRRHKNKFDTLRYASPGSLCITHYTLHITLLSHHSTPTAIMPKCCIICSAVAFQYCATCQSAMYCSKACQRIDWRKKQHRQICKLLNVGHGDMQVRTDMHTRRSIESKEDFERGEGSLRGDHKRFFKLFQEPNASRSGFCFTVCTFLFGPPTWRCFRGQTVHFS
jgi:hypothetical protein